MTPLLKAWKADADEFGIPETTQRGLAFMLALDLIANPPGKNTEECLEIQRRFSRHLPDLPQNIGIRFNEAGIAGLLSEFAFRIDSEFTPRKVYTALDGTGIYAFSRPAARLLPSFDVARFPMAVSDAVIGSLYRQLGEHIHGDLEAAFLAGHRFFASYYQMDSEATLHVSKLAVAFRPPHFFWFRHALNFPREHLADGNPMNKVLTCFLADTAEPLSNLTRLFADQLHYEAPRKKRQRIWDAEHTEFCTAAIHFWFAFQKCNPLPADWLAEFRPHLIESDFASPSVCTTVQAAVESIQDMVLARWGYDLSCPAGDLYFAERLVRRSAVLLSIVASAFLNPDWLQLRARLTPEY